MTERINKRPGKPVVGMKVVIYIDPPKFSNYNGRDKWFNSNANLFSNFVSSADFAAREIKETAEKLWGDQFDVGIELEYEEKE